MPEQAPQQQASYAPQGAPTAPGAPVAQPGYITAAPAAKGLAIAALIVGIVAFLTGLVPVLGLIIGFVGLLLGILALVKRQPKSLALTGTILSGIAVIVSLIATLIAGAFTAAVVETVEEGTSVTAEAPTGSDSATEETLADGGTRENPFPLGTVISSSDWDAVINSVNLSANDAVAAANTFNDPAPEGQQYAVVNVTVTYKGADTGIPSFVQIDYVTATGEVISTWDSFVIAPEPSFGGGELYAGGTSTGNLAFLIPSSADGILRVTPGMFADDVFVATS